MLEDVLPPNEAEHSTGTVLSSVKFYTKVNQFVFSLKNQIFIDHKVLSKMARVEISWVCVALQIVTLKNLNKHGLLTDRSTEEWQKLLSWGQHDSTFIIDWLNDWLVGWVINWDWLLTDGLTKGGKGGGTDKGWCSGKNSFNACMYNSTAICDKLVDLPL